MVWVGTMVWHHWRPRRLFRLPVLAEAVVVDGLLS
jgi:hypothetical protein